MTLETVEKTIKFGIVTVTAGLATLILTLPSHGADDVAATSFGPSVEPARLERVREDDGARYRVTEQLKTGEGLKVRPVLTLAFDGNRLLPDAGPKGRIRTQKKAEINFDRDQALFADLTLNEAAD